MTLDPTKELRLLLAFFGESNLPVCRPVTPDEVPPLHRQLLYHHEHMTVTLEKHYSCPVKVHPYKVHRQGDVYGRKLDLTCDTGRVVLTGIMIFNLSFVDEEIRSAIVEQKTPLGRILIERGIFREIAGVSLLRLEGSDPLVARFNQGADLPTFGRLATILCDGKPAVDLLEVVAPSP